MATTNTKPEKVWLGCLAATHFTDLESIRAFVTGNGAAAMSLAIQDALEGVAQDRTPLPENMLADARWAAHVLVDDLGKLARAAALGGDPDVRDGDGVEDRHRAALYMVALASGDPVADLRAALLQYLLVSTRQKAA